MPIAKGQPWGELGRLPDDGVIVRSDAEAAKVIEEARRQRRSPPVMGLLGGDLCRTLGGSGNEKRLRSEEAMTFPVDLGVALLDGRIRVFVAHLVARSRGWGLAFVAMNAQWIGRWNLGPRAHPGDGLLDTYDVHLPFGQRLPVRARLHHGAHLPHPGIAERRSAAVQITLDRVLPVRLDGVAVGKARNLSVRVEPDAFRVVV